MSNRNHSVGALMTNPHEIQRDHLRAVIEWSRKLRKHLGAIQYAHGHEVHFRPSSTGVAMIGLLPERPQRGKGGYRNLARLASSFKDEFDRWCRNVDQGRPTPEKRLQSYLLADAHSHGGAMTMLNEASETSDDPVHLELVTDELALPVGDGRKVVCDLLALRRLDSDGARPVVIELKSARQMARLVEQVSDYATLVEEHLELFAELAGILLKRDVELEASCKNWIVWPAVPGGEPRENELAAEGIRVVGYEEGDEGVLDQGGTCALRRRSHGEDQIRELGRRPLVHRLDERVGR